jgi:type IV pilus assembly protein PilO
MKKLLEFIESLSQRQLVGGAIALLVATWFGANYLILDPLRDEESKLLSEIDSLQSQLNTERRIAANLERYKKEVEAYRSVQELAERQLPQGREVPNLLSSVQALAKDIGLNVRRFAPERDKVSTHYAEIPVRIEMRGTFHQVVSFFDEISRLSRIVSVSDVSFINPRGYSEGGSVGLDVTCIITAYRQLTEDERRPKEEEVKGKKGKKTSGAKKK